MQWGTSLMHPHHFMLVHTKQALREQRNRNIATRRYCPPLDSCTRAMPASNGGAVTPTLNVVVGVTSINFHMDTAKPIAVLDAA